MVKKNKPSITAVVLAAGKGTRMKSKLPKVLHEVCGKPLIYYSLGLIRKIRLIKQKMVVLGFGKDSVTRTVRADFNAIEFSYQEKLNGSAKALQSALSQIKSSHILVMCADSMILDEKILKKFINYHFSRKSVCTVLTKDSESPGNLGRIIRDKADNLLKIKEKTDISASERTIKEVNTGTYIFNKEILNRKIEKIKPNKKKKEYYLTDIIEVLVKEGVQPKIYKMGTQDIFISVNNRRDLIRADRLTRLYLIGRLLDKGISIIDPQTTFLSPETYIGRDSVIYPFTFLENNVRIGACCSVGPFAHIREGTVIKPNTEIGNFTELVRSRIDSFAKVKHVSYLGDVKVGKSVNIGAGTIVANYDGKNKNRTVIKDKAFIGSNSVLVAPVTIGKDSVTGAGSVVTRKVKDKDIVVGVPAKKLKSKK